MAKIFAIIAKICYDSQIRGIVCEIFAMSNSENFLICFDFFFFEKLNKINNNNNINNNKIIKINLVLFF